MAAKMKKKKNLISVKHPQIEIEGYSVQIFCHQFWLASHGIEWCSEFNYKNIRCSAEDKEEIIHSYCSQIPYGKWRLYFYESHEKWRRKKCVFNSLIDSFFVLHSHSQRFEVVPHFLLFFEWPWYLLTPLSNTSWLIRSYFHVSKFSSRWIHIIFRPVWND